MKNKLMANGEKAAATALPEEEGWTGITSRV